MAIGQARVATQIVGVLRNPMLREISRTCANGAVRRRDLARDHVRRRQVRNAQCHVVTLLDRVDLLVAQNQLNAQVRIFFHEIGYGRREMQRAKRHRSVDPQQSTHLGLRSRRREIGFLQVGQDRKAALVICLTVLGRRHAARGAGKELDPKLLLQLDDVLAHG
jgi:hypothetical protein